MRVMAGAVAVILGVGGWTLSVDAGVECAMARGDAVNGRPFDASVGRDPRNYPPDPQVDFTWLLTRHRFFGASDPRVQLRGDVAFHHVGDAAGPLAAGRD